jgi:fatty-acyl-CoA synthase/long-chain acyl-CoA synthetase
MCDPHDSVENFLSTTQTDIVADYIITDSICGVVVKDRKGGEYPLNFNSDSASEFLYKKIDGNLPSTVIFTSGTTSNCKAVMLSQSGILSVSFGTQDLGWYLPQDIAIGILPLHHVFGLSLLVTATTAGYSLFFPERVEIDYIIECIERYKITRMNGVPTLYYSLAKANERLKRDISTLRTGLIGGAPVTEEQFNYIEKTLNVTMIPVYGMSECLGIACASYKDSAKKRSKTVGKFYVMGKGEIIDENGENLPKGCEGEIVITSPAVMLGYVPYKTRTEKLYTGDLGYVDEDDFLHITGRKKDVIIKNGINISPVKVERALLSLPEVEDAVVVGVYDSAVGEVPCAMVVLDESSNATPSTLKQKLATILTKIEIPPRIEVVKKIPLTSSGKHDKKGIKEFFGK